MSKIKPKLFSVRFPSHQPLVLLCLLLKISLTGASLLLLEKWIMTMTILVMIMIVVVMMMMD